MGRIPSESHLTEGRRSQDELNKFPHLSQSLASLPPKPCSNWNIAHFPQVEYSCNKMKKKPSGILFYSFLGLQMKSERMLKRFKKTK